MRKGNVLLNQQNGLFTYNYVFRPEHRYKSIWDFVVSMALVITCIVVPFRLAFYFFDDGNKSKWSEYSDLFLDALFVLDILVSFNTGFIDQKTFFLQSDRAKIVCNYLKSWFIIDLLAVIPFETIMKAFSQSDSAGSLDTDITNFGKVAKFSRIYRAFKLARMFKTAKMVKERRKLRRTVPKGLRIKVAFERLWLFLVFFFLTVHIQACIWVFVSKSLEEQGSTNWVQEGDFDEMNEL